MDEKMIVSIVISGLLSLGHLWVSGSEVDVKVNPGDNVTIFCDCTISLGTLITWYRNCSHVHQPSLILRLKKKYFPNIPQSELMRPKPRFEFIKNHSSNSYDLLITNLTQSDEGLYFCGTETATVTEYTYGNVTTKITVMSRKRSNPDPKDCGVCWTLLFLLCPTLAFLSSLISVLVICLKKNKKGNVYFDQNEITAARASKRHRVTTATKTEVGDVSYATLEIRQASQRTKKKSDSSNFCTYSAVRTPIE